MASCSCRTNFWTDVSNIYSIIAYVCFLVCLVQSSVITPSSRVGCIIVMLPNLVTHRKEVMFELVCSQCGWAWHVCVIILWRFLLIWRCQMFPESLNSWVPLALGFACAALNFSIDLTHRHMSKTRKCTECDLNPGKLQHICALTWCQYNLPAVMTVKWKSSLSTTVLPPNVQ